MVSGVWEIVTPNIAEEDWSGPNQAPHIAREAVVTTVPCIAEISPCGRDRGVEALLLTSYARQFEDVEELGQAKHQGM